MASTILIGEDSLLIQCGKILLSRDYDIKLVVSPIKKIQEWALRHQIPYVRNLSELRPSYSNISVHYIFSIVNSVILPNEFIGIARCGAINYHDSILPLYAGLNATTWAILNNEKKHGVTWHLITSGIDEGDILKQLDFPIDDHDTAFSLNLRCYEFAIKSFQELLDDLEKCILSPQKQNLKLRNYYPASYPLPDFGFINWSSFSAEQIYRLYRALSFGNYKNNLGTLKIYLYDQYYIVSKLELSPLNLSCSSPGEVVAIDENSIHISTLTKNIQINQLLFPSGLPIKINRFIKKYGIKLGFKFESLVKEDYELLKEQYSASLSSEALWKKNLLDQTQHAIFSKKGFEIIKKMKSIPLEINLRNIFPNKRFDSIEILLMAAILIYLYRLNNYDNTSVSIVFPGFEKFKNRCGNLFNYFLPMNFNVTPYFSLKDIVEFLKEKINDMQKKSAYLTDLMIRNPAFENETVEPKIVISLTDLFDKKFLPKDCILFFQIDKEAGVIRVNHRFSSSSNLKTVIQGMMSRIIEHIANILINLISNPCLLVNDFSFLPEYEQFRLVCEFGLGIKTDLPVQSIAECFYNQALLRPKNIAIFTESSSICYDKLSEYSENIAGFIAGEFPSVPSLIGIYLDRSMEMIAAILGILKVGAAYVPLDTQYPMSRIGDIVKDTGLALIFTKGIFYEKFREFFNENNSINLTCVENIITKKFPLRIAAPPVSEKLAYIIYTSGTTRKPKGVMVTEKNVLNYCYWFSQTTHLDSTSIMDFSSSLAFDLSVPCTIAPLLVGGAIAICSEMNKINPREYLSHLERRRVTHVEMTPGYMHLLLDYPEQICQLQSLKWLLLGADTVSRTDVEKWLSLCPQHQLINEYGPTETTVAVTSYFINRDQLPHEATVPIGQPAFNTNCYVLDKYSNLCPIGAVGELWVSGAQVSLGYFNKPATTQNKFIVSNVGKQKNERFYKTGDLVYWLPDGNLHFLGRNDRQVKIMGYRVETAEIESTLTKIPGITQAIVIVQEEKFKDSHLKAYLIVENFILYLDDLRKTLKDYLPNYMIPREFYVVDYIPLKENEKIDYPALQKQPSRLLKNQKASSISNDNFQETILQIWQLIFNDDAITMDDNFFDVGGDSFSALQIIDAIRRQYSAEIPVIFLFNYPTVSTLANKVREFCKNRSGIYKSTSINHNIIIPLSEARSQIPLFLVHPVGGTIFWYKKLSALLQGKYTIYGIQDPNIDHSEIKFKSLEEMAEYYLKAISSVYSGETYFLGGASFGSSVAIEMAHQLLKINKNIGFLGLFDGWAKYPLSLMEKEPPLLHRLDAEREKKLSQLERHRKQLLLNYQLPYLNVHTHLFKAIELWPEFQEIDDPLNGWCPYVGNSMSVFRVPGNHESMFFSSNVQFLSKLLLQKLLKSAFLCEGSPVPASLNN